MISPLFITVVAPTPTQKTIQHCLMTVDYLLPESSSTSYRFSRSLGHLSPLQNFWPAFQATKCPDSGQGIVEALYEIKQQYILCMPNSFSLILIPFRIMVIISNTCEAYFHVYIHFSNKVFRTVCMGIHEILHIHMFIKRGLEILTLKDQ